MGIRGGLLESPGEWGLQWTHSHTLCFLPLCRPSNDGARADSGVWGRIALECEGEQVTGLPL